ncbi:MAG TPA: MarR family transcriptional regulator [Chloroflexota bacterium]|nr:MarR family transcriptional regulator [Chloroflexota bacterium]
MIPAQSQEQSLSDLVADQLRRINRQLRASSQEDWTSLSLTRAQLKILVLLRQDGPTTVGHLASHLAVTLPSITATIDRLVHQGLVSREDDPTDRRRVINQLTQTGTVLIERLQEGRRARLVMALQQLSPEDLDALSNVLNTFEQAILHLPRQED